MILNRKEDRGHNMKKKIGLLLFIVMLCLLQVPAAAATKRVNQWVTYKGNKYYYNAKGKKVKSTFKKIGKYYYHFDSKGRMTKNQFFKSTKYLYYFDKKGRALTGWQKLKGNTYYFNQRGRALTGLQKIDGSYYYFDEDGKRQTGWQIIGNRKSYFSPKTGKRVSGKKVNGIKIGRSGKVKLDKEDKLSVLAQETIDRITTPGMSKSQKLKACFDYLDYAGGFGYRTWRPYSYYSGWSVDYAYEMLSAKAGNCYNFACAFAYLAKELGYDPVIVRGRIPGSRDGAADGYTRHCWVMINGLHYDPEGAYADFAYVYASSYYPMGHQIQATERI